MKVTLISYTRDALDLLIFSKQTRLRMDVVGYDEIASWPYEKKIEELEYMLNTIQSSWEFVDYVFMIEDVTRAFTHQLVRTRVGASFAQQSQRSVDMADFNYETGPSISGNIRRQELYDYAMMVVNDTYKELLDIGSNAQDARGLLPTNIHTNILFKANLRTLHDMGMLRLCTKTQGEYQEVFRKIREQVISVHPWAEKFIRVWCAFHGTCMFPTFPTEDCHVKSHVYNPKTGLSYGGYVVEATLEDIQGVWEMGKSEAQTKVK